MEAKKAVFLPNLTHSYILELKYMPKEDYTEEAAEKQWQEAAVFVPLPTAVDDHQTANARFLANINAAKICPQADMTAESLTALLQPLMNRQLLMEMAVKARQQAQPDATQHVVRLIQDL